MSQNNIYTNVSSSEIMESLGGFWSEIRKARESRLGARERSERISYGLALELGRANAVEQSGKHAGKHRIAALGMAIGATTDSSLMNAFVEQLHQTGLLIEQEVAWVKSLAAQLCAIDASKRQLALQNVSAQTDNLHTVLTATRLGAEV